MKRVLLLLILTLSVSICHVNAEETESPHNANADRHLAQLVKCINDSDFACAAIELPQVNDWSWSTDSIPYTNVDNAYRLITYLASTDIEKQYIDSLCKYVVTDADIHSLYIFFEGQVDEAVAMYKTLLAIQEISTGKQSVEYATYLYNMGQMYFLGGLYSLAETCFWQVEGLQRQLLGTQNIAYSHTINMLGVVFGKQRDYNKAEQYYLQAKAIREAILPEPENDYDYAIILNNLATAYVDNGMYKEAETYYMRVQEIFKKIVGEEHQDYAVLLFNIGCYYKDIGEYQKAEQYFLQSLEISKNVVDETADIDYAMTLSALGLLYENAGNYVRAQEIQLEALNKLESILGNQHLDYILALGRLGYTFLLSEDYEQAEEYLLRACETGKAVLGENSAAYIETLSSLGSLYIQTQRFDEAEKILLKAQSLSFNNTGEQTKEYAMLLNNLGVVYFHKGDFEQAERMTLQCFNIRSSLFSSSHPDNALSLYNLGDFYFSIHNSYKAFYYFKEGASSYKSQFVSSVNYMTESQRTLFWQNIIKRYFETYNTLFSYRYYPENHQVAGFVYDSELFKKGLLLSSSDVVRRSVFESADTTLIKQWNELVSKKEQIKALEERSPQMENIVQLKSEVEGLEKDITKSSAAYRENMRQWNITWDSVRAELKPNQVAIEYMSAPLNEDSTMYCALLLRDTCSHPILIPLFEEKEVVKLIDVNNPSSINRAYTYADNGKELSRLIWQNVVPYLNPGEVVFFAPTGILHEVALEYIPYDSIQTISEVYNPVRLSSTREIVLHKNAIPHRRATLYGGIQYDVNEDELLAQSTLYKQFASRAIIDDTINRGRVIYLRGTKVEVEQIAPMLKAKKYDVQVYSASSANEESFKALSGTRQNILHIATHGFYWSDSTARTQQYFTQHQTAEIDPLDRCGLLFAGANIALSGHSDRLPQGVQDGILTAREISTMDLRDADIVVLSACETGKGDISGEGVFGLQRAFKMAGAQTMLMAIWPVDDEATRMLMTVFYQNYSKGQSKRQAFRNAQQAVKNYVRTQTVQSVSSSAADKFKNKGQHTTTTSKTITTKPYESPYYWAGFILLD